MKNLKQWQQLPDDAVYASMDSPVGQLTIVASTKGVYRIAWMHEVKSEPVRLILASLKHQDQHPMIIKIKQQLQEYFHGQRKVFELPVCFIGTAFQLQAWQALREIPYGQTISYGEQAKRLGDAKKARAVGMANGANPVSIIVPCHRVIGSNGTLTGFGGGLNNKARLLEIEQQNERR